MLKKVKNKVLCVTLIVAMALLSSVCFCALQWSYLTECSNDISEVTIGLFQKGISCFGDTLVDDNNYAGITVYLKYLDEDGDWVTETAWQDQDYVAAVVDTEYEVSAGTYKLELTHKAYLPSDLDNPVEIHYSESAEVVVD